MIVKRKDIKEMLFLLFLILPFFKPEYLSMKINILSALFFILQIISFSYCILYFIKKKYISKILLLIILYFGLLAIPTFLYNSDNLLEYFKIVLSTIGICFVFDLGLKFYTKNFLKTINYLLLTYILINFFTIVLFPNGMYIRKVSLYTENWFLGYKNDHILYIFPYIILMITNCIYNKNKIDKKSIILFFICLLSILLVNSSTSIIGIFIIFIFIIFHSSINTNNIFHIKSYLFSYIVVYFGIIIFRVQNLFQFLIVNILGKKLTFTDRVYIWDNTIQFIKQKIFLGYGFENSTKRYLKTYTYRVYHAHNQFLEIIYKSGLIGLISFCLIIISASKKLYKYRSYYIGKFLSWSFLSLLIMMLMEYYQFNSFMYLFVLYYHIDKLIYLEK